MVSFSRYRAFGLPAALIAFFAPAERAEGSAIYFSTGEATLQFLSLEHAGGGVGVDISRNAAGCPCVEDFTGDAFADQSVEADLSAPGIVIISSSAIGEATDGEALSGSMIDGFFQVDNQSPFEVTAFFALSATIAVQANVSGSVGSAFASASLDVSSTSAGFLERQSVEAETNQGSDESLFFFLGRIFSMTVQPGSDEFFSVSLRTEGTSSAVPQVSEPVTSFFLALGLSAAALSARGTSRARARRRGESR